MPRKARYLHGTAPREQRRLSRLNDIMNDATLKELALPRGANVIDFGSGLGQLTRAMARAAGSGARVLGIESSEEQLTEARRQAAAAGEAKLVEMRHGDVMDPPLTKAEWGSFDVAHARFILEHVTDPLGVVRQMVKAVKPGGRVALADDDHDVLRLWPEPVGVSAVWRAYQRTYDRNGTDPIVGRRLVQLLYEAGANPVRNTWIFFGSCSGRPEFAPLVDNMASILEGARDTIVEHGFFEGAACDAATANLRAWGKRPDAAIWFSICWAEGVRPKAKRGR